MGSKVGREAGAGETELSSDVHHPGTPPQSWVKPGFRLRPLQLGLSRVYRYLAATGNIQETTKMSHMSPTSSHISLCRITRGSI